jgi:hypothetical protein
MSGLKNLFKEFIRMSAPTNTHAISRPHHKRVGLSLIVLALSLVVFLVVLSPASGLRPAWAQTGTFTFTFAGDFGTGSAFTANMNKMAQAGAAFDLAVGDLSYGGSPSSWCTSVKNIVGSTFPFEVLVGNHDDDGDSAHINNFTPCLPDRLGSTGVYGSEYYFDYSNARVIMVAAGLTVNGVGYNYNSAGTHQTWLIDRIREAKAAGKWVIVGNHLNCVDTGTKPCEAGQGFTNVIHNEHVDLVIQGHDHTYQRTKQLTCATSGSYNSACVADADDSLVKGAGTVTIINGLGGQGQYDINASDSERNYFVKAMGGNGWWNFRDSTSGGGHEYGIVKVTVSASQMNVVWVPSQVTVAGFPGDSFTITGGPTPTPCGTCPTNTPTNTQAPSSNVLQNPGFETAGTGGAADAANWTEGTNHARASDKFNTGAWSLKSTFRSTGTNTQQTASVVASTSYTFSGYIWRTNTVGGACLDMSDLVGELQHCVTTAGSWQFKSGTWNSGTNTSVTIRAITDGSPTGDIWFDDISLTGPGGGGPTNTPTNTPVAPTNTPTNTPIGPTNTPTNTPVPSGNVVQNPGFETAGASSADAASWTEGTLHARASDKFNTGAWSLKSTFRSTGTDTRQTVTTTTNKTYTYSGYIWRTNSTGGACMDMNDIAGELTLCTTTSGSWQFKTGTWNSGTNTSVTLRLITDASPTGDIWFDDISLQ